MREADGLSAAVSAFEKKALASAFSGRAAYREPSYPLQRRVYGIFNCLFSLYHDTAAMKRKVPDILLSFADMMLGMNGKMRIMGEANGKRNSGIGE